MSEKNRTDIPRPAIIPASQPITLRTIAVGDTTRLEHWARQEYLHDSYTIFGTAEVPPALRKIVENHGHIAFIATNSLSNNHEIIAIVDEAEDVDATHWQRFGAKIQALRGPAGESHALIIYQRALTPAEKQKQDETDLKAKLEEARQLKDDRRKDKQIWLSVVVAIVAVLSLVAGFLHFSNKSPVTTPSPVQALAVTPPAAPAAPKPVLPQPTQAVPKVQPPAIQPAPPPISPAPATQPAADPVEDALQAYVRSQLAPDAAAQGLTHIRLKLSTPLNDSAYNGTATCTINGSIVADQRTLVFPNSFTGNSNTGDTDQALDISACENAVDAMITSFHNQ